MIAKIKTAPIPRAPEVTERAVVLGLGARFTDELLSGLPDVLMPTLRSQFRLSYTQISLLYLALNYVAAVVGPIAALLIDISRRRWLLAWGAAGVGLAVITLGLAPTFLILLAGYVIYGLASGPLAHTGDVVLVEAHPEAPDRIFARATLFDTFGALLAPMLVTLTIWLNLGWRALLVSLGVGSLIYALLVLRTHFPPPKGTHEGKPALAMMRQNLQEVLRSRPARTWLGFIFVFELFETPFAFTTVWLHDQVGMNQALVAIYGMTELVVSLASLGFLDRWLARMPYTRVLQIANAGLLVLVPLWLLLPGIWTRFLVGIPFSFLFAVFWPIGRSQMLASVPGRAGAVTAVASLIGILPLPLLFSLLAEAVGLTTAILWVSMLALLLLAFFVRLLPRPENQVAMLDA